MLETAVKNTSSLRTRRLPSHTSKTQQSQQAPPLPPTTDKVRFKPSTPRRPRQTKHVFLALAAGTWCILSIVTLCLSRSGTMQQQQQQPDALIHGHLQQSHEYSSLSNTLLSKQEHIHHAKDPSLSLQWNPTKALSTLRNNFYPPFGFTMRDLARRVLSRHVANSNVLVIAPDAQQALFHYHEIANVTLDSVDYTSSLQHSLGGNFVLHSRHEGHATHAMNAGMNVRTGQYTRWNKTLDQWWSEYNTTTTTTTRRPNWLLLSVVDPGFGWEDVVWRDSSRFLQESTMTYIVTAVRSRFGNKNTTLEMYGLQATKALLEKRYKMQVLSVSHYHVEFDYKGNDKRQYPTTYDKFGPNALLKTPSNVEALLTWGAESARRYSNSTQESSPVFTAYLFGTQGLDLAIPSRRQYIPDDSRIKGDESWTQINLYKPVEFKPCPKSKSGLTVGLRFEKSDKESDMHIEIYSGSNKPSSPEFKATLSPWSIRMRAKSPFFRKAQNTWHQVCHFVHGYIHSSTKMTRPGVHVTSSLNKGTYEWRPVADARGMETHFRGNNQDDDSSLQVWYDNRTSPRASEAACARYNDAVTCETRIIYKPNPLWLSNTSARQGQRLRQGEAADNGAHINKNLDLLLIMLDPMSRGQLHRSMPQTKAILEELGFLQFTQYSSVGDNSGPNQAALYSGKPLANRDGIANDGKSEWLWDTLRKAGYVTLKGEDGCIENSNMLQSLKPNVTHGEALNQMFCFDFNRPNCIGPEPAASYLLRYGRQFIDTYGSTTMDIRRQPWAAFLHFVDSHEDTSTLSTLLDSLLAQFLKESFETGKLDNALVLVTSDHGLHYGPYFQTLSGRRERTEPLLYIRTPSAIQESSKGRIMEANAPLWTTPFDVHRTMIDLTVGRSAGVMTDSLVTPLAEIRKSCRGTEAIPERFCELHEIFKGKRSNGADSCPRAPRPPSILSFYADIPKKNRPKLVQPNCSKTQGEPLDFENGCICATSHRNFYPCNEHPWGPKGINSTDKPEEYFAVVKCPNRVERLDSRVMRRQVLVDRYQNRTNVIAKDKKTAGVKTDRSPDVLVLEIDSVSKAYAERHLPLTMKFLRKHRIQRDESDRDAFDCINGVCALDFERFAIVGANSVANQVPALSGCVVSRFHESCFKGAKLSTDKCLENGLFGTKDGCEACPVGTFPVDPLRPCNTTKDTPEKCCTSVFPSYNASRICRDESLFEHDLQLFRRGPRRHTTWCPTNTTKQENDASPKTPTQSPWLFDVARTEGYLTYFGEEFCYDKSPYVTQDNTFPLQTDFELRNVYCRLQSCTYEKHCEGPWPPMGPHICVETGGENPAFTQISDIWDAYPDVPKFAFLNGIAAHDYDFEWIKMIASLEAYDAQLASFLERITSSKRFENTVLVARTDHGLQGGPTTVEYSVQVEHREPWTQIVIPKKLAGKSLSVLAANQDRMATGYDLYHSIRNLMSSSSSNHVIGAPPIPDWAIDFFTTEIPSDRTCQDAKIPDDFCPCEGTGIDRAPHFGVCNVFEPYNDLFCASNLDSPLPPESATATVY